MRAGLACLVLLALIGCGPKAEGPAPSGPASPVDDAASSTASLNKDDYAVFPDADAGADPGVPAEQGGRGFNGEGWETNTAFDLIGNPRAVKGGLYREAITDFPGTLRMGGPEWNTYVNYMIGNLVYESLLTLDPTTLNYIPVLATHWQISPDKHTFRFRINPNARFSDGAPVTAEDVVASWTLYADKKLNDPALNTMFGKLERPVAESRYIVRVASREPDWKNFLNFAAFMLIFPAHALKDVDGAAYLRDYNFKYLPGTGPYMITEADIQKGQSLNIRRRKDFWDEKSRRSAGLNNFDEVRLIVVRDPNLTFEKFKKGDLDFYFVNRAKIWIEEMDFDKIQRGVIQKRKIFNNTASGYNGVAINTRRKPFDDIRVRKALALLMNRALYIEKLFHSEYLPMNSYFAGSVYENPGNAANPYNPDDARKLLEEAGWKDRDAQGRLTKEGKPLSIELLYDSKTAEPYLTVYQEDLHRAGITLNLRFVTFETQYKLVSDRQFDLAEVGWGGSMFPDPEQQWHSRLADVRNTDNITGFKDPRIDAICEKYAQTFDLKERVALMRELDGIATRQYHYVLKWRAPAERIAYWNRFGHPSGYFTRTGDYMSDLSAGPGIERLWWIDPAASKRLDEAMADSSVKLPVGATEDRYWLEREAAGENPQSRGGVQ